MNNEMERLLKAMDRAIDDCDFEAQERICKQIIEVKNVQWDSKSIN